MNGYFPALAKEHRVTTECVKVETRTTLRRSVLPVQWRDRGKEKTNCKKVYSRFINVDSANERRI